MTARERVRYMAKWRREHGEYRAAYERQRRLDAGITKFTRSGRPKGMYRVEILGVRVDVNLLRRFL
jgi:hypothetical protein